MKTKHKQELPFGDLVMAAYQVWGSCLAAKMLRLAIKDRFVVFNGRPYYLGASMKGKSA
jgi:hypothetical protein